MATATLVALGNISDAYKEQVRNDPQQEAISQSAGVFASGEPYVELYYDQRDKYAQNKEKLRGAKALVYYAPEMDSAEQREQLYMLLDDLKRYGAKEATVVLPSAPFERQDKDEKGKFYSNGLAVFARNLKANGADRIVRLTPHSNDAVKIWKEQFADNFIQVSAAELFAERIRSQHPDLNRISIGAPDGAEKEADEGQKRALDLARALFGDLPDEKLKKHMFLISKSHQGFDSAGNTITQIEGDIKGDVKGKHCIIIDDMIDGGSTMKKASFGLRALGASSVEGMATHGILSNNALPRLFEAPENPEKDKAAPLDSVTLTDSLPSVEKKRAALLESAPELAEKVTVLSSAPLLAKAVAQLPELSQGTGSPGARR